jgi:2-succinyl-5-enolpyruvyl-6-hydroxy-3-cyclohexene-1-carboxylate synthase
MSKTAEIARLWASLLVEELVRCDVGPFFVSPGARSTPLVLALAAHPEARSIVHMDERGAAFAAVGHARATGRPAVWVTTSGSAVGNGLPAVIEASAAGVPLICLTADRPPELRGAGANQTIDQPGIFGRFARWHVDLPVPTPEIDPAYLLTTIDHAVARATDDPPGPVHVNCMFREPLVGEMPGETSFPEHIVRWREEGRPFTTIAGRRAMPDSAEMRVAAAALEGVGKGLVVCGQATPAEARAAVRLALRIGWPCYADITSNGRLAADADEALIGHLDQALLADRVRELRPEAILWVGGRIVSRRVAEFLADGVPTVVAIRRDSTRIDPHHRVTHLLAGNIEAICESLAGGMGEKRPGGWQKGWTAIEDSARGALREEIDGQSALSEPSVARTVGRLIPDGHALFLSSSMPVRDADMFVEVRRVDVLTGSNRGASGIDGVLASAAGFAAGAGRATTVLMGDLALLHDLNALDLVRRSEHPLVVVVVNNDGGGIFSFLPMAGTPAFEKFFGTPHGRSFEHAAAMFDLPYACPADREAFERAYREALTSGRSTLIEVRTDRAGNVEVHRHLNRRLVAACESAG